MATSRNYPVRMLCDFAFYEELFSYSEKDAHEVLRKLAHINATSTYAAKSIGQNLLIQSEYDRVLKLGKTSYLLPHGVGADIYDDGHLAWEKDTIAKNLTIAQMLTPVPPNKWAILTGESCVEKYRTHKKYRDETINFQLENVKIYGGLNAHDLIEYYSTIEG